MLKFKDKILKFSEDIEEKKDYIENEETTKTALILPFLRLMGYDTTNPKEVKTEFSADIGAKQGEKVDIAILNEDNVLMLIECKPANSTLDKANISQLYRYFNITDSEIGILTNGIVYNFYTDSKKNGMMDKTPFLEFNFLDIKESKINELEAFTKNNFNMDSIKKKVNDLKYVHDINGIISKEMNNPSDEFVKVITKQVYDGILTQKVKDKFAIIIKNEFKQVINEKVNKRLNEALSENHESNNIETVDEFISDEFTISKIESEGYYIVESILSEYIDVERIFLNKHKYFTSILLDNKRLCPLCKLYFNNPKRLQLGLIDSIEGNKKIKKVPISNLSDIYNYKEQLIKTLKYYGK